jgi:DNA-binding PadR family transcriptional regulator
MSPREPGRSLSPAVLQIMLALADGARHGYAIKQEVEARTDGEIRLGPGTLYEAIQRLETSGLIEETDERAGDDRAQRRYYRLTREGMRVLRREIQQLERLVEHARSKSVLKKARHG